MNQEYQTPYPPQNNKVEEDKVIYVQELGIHIKDYKDYLSLLLASTGII